MRFIDIYYPHGQIEVSRFYRLPRTLAYLPELCSLSSDAKLLYTLMLDRLGLSIQNAWYDASGRIYIYFSIDEVQRQLNCSRQKAMRVLSELDDKKGVGLIQRVKQGQGKPSRIYVRQIPDVEFSLETALENLKKAQKPSSESILQAV